MPTPSPEPDWVDLPAAAAEVGVHPRTVRRWVSSGHLKAARFGPRLLRVDRNELHRAGQPAGGAA